MSAGPVLELPRSADDLAGALTCGVASHALQAQTLLGSRARGGATARNALDGRYGPEGGEVAVAAGRAGGSTQPTAVGRACARR